MRNWLYRWLPIIFGCHCRPDRSFFWKGRQFPICARCTGELVGLLGTAVLGWVYLPSVKVSLLLLVPLIVDGFVQRLTRYESTNVRRLITGMLFGIGMAALIGHFAMDGFYRGLRLGQRLRTSL